MPKSSTIALKLLAASKMAAVVEQPPSNRRRPSVEPPPTTHIWAGNEWSGSLVQLLVDHEHQKATTSRLNSQLHEGQLPVTDEATGAFIRNCYNYKLEKSGCSTPLGSPGCGFKLCSYQLSGTMTKVCSDVACDAEKTDEWQYSEPEHVPAWCQTVVDECDKKDPKMSGEFKHAFVSDSDKKSQNKMYV